MEGYPEYIVRADKILRVGLLDYRGEIGIQDNRIAVGYSAQCVPDYPAFRQQPAFQRGIRYEPVMGGGSDGGNIPLGSKSGRVAASITRLISCAVHVPMMLSISSLLCLSHSSL